MIPCSEESFARSIPGEALESLYREAEDPYSSPDSLREKWKRVTRAYLHVTGAVCEEEALALPLARLSLPAAEKLYRTAAMLAKREMLGEYGDIAEKCLYNAPGDTLSPEDGYCVFDNTLALYLYRNTCICAEVKSLPVSMSVTTDYPESGLIEIAIKDCPGDFALALRLPEWVKTYRLTLNDHTAFTVMDNGYLTLHGLRPDDLIRFDICMEPVLIAAHPKITACAFCRAVQKGPVIYACAQKGFAVLRGAKPQPAPDRRILLPGFVADCNGLDEYELYASARCCGSKSITADFLPCRELPEAPIWVPCQNA